MIRSDRTVRVLLGTLTFLLAGNLIVLLNRPGTHPVMAAQGIPDSGAQLQSQIDQLKDLNSKVEKLQSFLESGNLTVKVKDTKTEK